ncbi:unnamed protein product [Rhizophagus irregularis]|nr:unnamed protein product [Rhizophagus irregularis]
MNYLKENSANWITENEKIENINMIELCKNSRFSSNQFELICPIIEIYGISQNSDIKNYVIIFNDEYFSTYNCKNCYKVFADMQYKWCKQCQINYLKNNFTNWISENENVDNFIQKIQLNITHPTDVIFEWIPYNQFGDIKEIGKLGFATVYSAKCEDGPLTYNENTKKYERHLLNSEFALKVFQNIQLTDEFLYKVKTYLIEYSNDHKLYGISQNPNTANYILILYSGNEEVDNFIQKKQLEISNYNDIIIEWIPYHQFEKIKEIGKDDLSTVYLATWKDGPLNYEVDKRRISNKTVILKFLDNSQYEFLNKVKEITNKFDKFKIDVLNIYGISQDPNMKNYIIVFQNKRCVCVKYYLTYEWCKFCHIKKFTNLNGNKKIDDLIQKMQLKIHNPGTLVFEWIPYDKFINLKEIDKGGFSVIYSAIWEDGPLYYDFSKMEYIRDTCKKVALKCLNNSQNLTDNFFNEIEKYSTDNFSLCILKTYGISQVPDTNDYIMVFEYAENGNLNNWVNKNYKNFSWLRRLNILQNIIKGLKEIHQKGLVHRDFHTGNILLMTSNFGNDISFISDMGLCGEVGNMDETKANIYGIMPSVAPKVLRGRPSTHSADIYSFAMIMYFVAAGKQPFVDHAHDNVLALDICNGIRPEINEQEAPKCYIDLMNKCWDSKPQNRPNAIEIDKLISSFRDNFIAGKGEQFKELEISIENNQSSNLLKNYLMYMVL